MSINSISNVIISTLGNQSSLIPLAIKDTINSAGITYYSYDAGGKLEGKDRLIDEFGTQAIWLLGLPVFKGIADKTFYTIRQLDPEVDVRVSRSKDHVEFAQKLLKYEIGEGKTTLDNICETVKRLPEFKGLFYAKFALATILTFASYFALTKYKQNLTEKAVKKEYFLQKANESFLDNKAKESKQFEEFNQVTFAGTKNNKPSFKGLESFMFDPVKNLMIIDAGITSERLHKSRNKYEFAEYGIKEGSLLFFMYFAGAWIQKSIQQLSEKILKTPIDMDLRFINSDILKKNIKKPILDNEIKEFSKLNTQKEILNFIANNKDSVIVEGAKLSGIIGQFKNGDINPAKYIDTEEMKAFVELLKKFKRKSIESSDDAMQFIKKARNYKIGAIFANIGICCFALGYLMPKAIFEYRKKHSGSKEFHVATQVRSKLEQSFSGNKI